MTKPPAGDRQRESPMRRTDRRYSELLQELRVAQTGVQVLLACLLALAFTPRFAYLTGFERGVYGVSLLLGAASAAMLIAPVPCHRMLFQRRLKRQLVAATARFMVYGLLLLLLSVGAAALLVIDVVFDGRFAAWWAAGTMGWFGAWWYVVPMCNNRRRSRLG
ncbi:hypothetical protein HC031_20155 [Planosporangium thailandense]|uniref:Amine oxidase n=1 Tax=Planosporangium thailandense TaxID=765197 RepID=A0ABX0Y1Q5_9ACTN|nr:DUF6328 family protein [Planosporangium thailandense]NJC72011.1 hypothetical protein [Planosporangium thailandense]